MYLVSQWMLHMLGCDEMTVLLMLGHRIQKDRKRWRNDIHANSSCYMRHKTMSSCFSTIYMREIYLHITSEHLTIKLLKWRKKEEKKNILLTTEFNGVHCHNLLFYRMLALSFLSEYVRFIEFSHLIILIMVVTIQRRIDGKNLFAINFTQTFIDLLNITRWTRSCFICCLKCLQNYVGNDVFYL